MNSNFISVDKLYYALEGIDPQGGTATYGTPKPMNPAVKISVDPTIASGDFYADGAQMERATQFVSAKVSLETAVLPLSVEADLLGHELDDKGGMVYNKDDHAPYVAIMYRRKKANGHYRYVKLFKVMFADGKDDGQTVSNSLKIQDESIDGVAMPRYSDGNWKTIADQDESGYTDVSTSWFQSVSGAATPLTITSSTPVDNATAVADSSTVVLKFSANLNQDTVTVDNIFLTKASDGTKVSASVAYNDSNKTVTITPTASLAATSGYIVTVTKAVADTAGNTLGNVYTANFTTV